MSKPAIITGVVLAIILVIVMWVIGNYNSLVSSQIEVEKSWSMIETQYQRRMDIVDNLVNIAKGDQTQELAVIKEIVDARKIYNAPTSSDNEKVSAASSIENNTVALVQRLQEAYPDRKSNQLMQTLMSDLKGTEDGILKARNDYNTTAAKYNKVIRRLPNNIFANSFGFSVKTLFKAETGADKATKVSF